MCVAASIPFQPAAAQTSATIEIRTSGLPQDADLSKIVATFEPTTILVDPGAAAAFNAALGGWKATTRPLAGNTTSLVVRLRSDAGTALSPDISLDLPFRSQTILMDVHVGSEPPIDGMMEYYRANGGLDAQDMLRAFVMSEQVIAFLQGNATASAVPISAPMARALIVYAEAVNLLLQQTEWFGRPRALSDRLDMVKRIRVNAGANLRRDINMERLQNAETVLRSAEPHLLRRVWQYSVHGAPHCLDRFANALALYESLAAMPRQAYQESVEKSGITASLALLAATQCYRQLLTIDGDRRRALPQVVAGPFKARSASVIAALLQTNIEQELQALKAQEDSDPFAEPCAPPAPTTEPGASLCKGLTYIKEVRPLLVETVAEGPS
jgi:hypothetical protein